MVGFRSTVGSFISTQLEKSGWAVIGTSRRSPISEPAETFPVVRCDLGSPIAILEASIAITEVIDSWDLLLFCSGTMKPIGPLVSQSSDEWLECLQINALGPLELLRRLWPVRNGSTISNVGFFGGGGTNGPFTNYSAYCLSKLMLIKACELLDDEEPSGNFFVIGPGYFRSPIHDETVAAGVDAGLNLERTLSLLTGDGTDLAEIYRSLLWCLDHGRDVVGGRNLSTVHDDWSRSPDSLHAALRSDPQAFKLRRRGLVQSQPPLTEELTT